VLLGVRHALGLGRGAALDLGIQGVAVRDLAEGVEEVADHLGGRCVPRQLERAEGEMVPSQETDGAAQEPAGGPATEPVPPPEGGVMDEDRQMDQLDGRGHLGRIVAAFRRARRPRAQEDQERPNAGDARGEESIGVEARRGAVAPGEITHRLIEVLQPEPEIFEKELGIEARASENGRTNGCHGATLTQR
jgi:hypothetical protein